MSAGWYRHQAVLAALAINERLRERDGQPDPIWATLLFNNLLELDVDGQEEQEPFVDPMAFPRSVRQRLQNLANSTRIAGWRSARFRSATSSAAARTAKLISTLLHTRAAPPRSLWRIASEELSNSRLPPAETVVRELEALSKILSRPRKREDKLRAITRFASNVPSLAETWPALEPALVQPLLEWVPAVFGVSNNKSGRPGLMVPLMIDVVPSTRSNSATGVVVVTGSLQDSSDLMRSAEVARNAACRLWRARFSNAPTYRRAQVAASCVNLDLQLIEGIADVLSSANQQHTAIDVGGRLYLSGRSLELPIAIAIYDRLVGSRLSGQIRASGVLVKFVPDDQDEESGDTLLGLVEGETAKALAAEAQLADCFVLATGSDVPAAQVPAVFASRLGAAVDFAFGAGGDGHRFVRAADVAAEFKRKRHPESAVIKVRDRLRASGPVLEHKGALSLLVQALFQVSASLGERAFRSRGRYTFVRLSPTERADAAWATIWSAVDGDPADLDAFIRASGDEKRAKLFAKQMIRNKPSLEDPRWSPHLLVVAGVADSQKVQGLSEGAYARFAIPRIMHAAGALLTAENSPCDRRLRLRLGLARIVLVSDEGMPRSDRVAPTLEPILNAAVEKLSAFRYGFSFAMARRQLSSSGTPLASDICFDILQRLSEIFYDGQPLLVTGATNRGRREAAPTAFEFMLRWHRLPGDPRRRQEVHSRAAQAILPILRPSTSDAHVDLATGLSAPWIDEAYSQLSAARSIALRRRDDKALSALAADRIRLLRISGTLVLERLPALMGRTGSRPAYEDFVERLKPTDHPSLHARAAAFAVKLAVNQEVECGRKELFAAALAHLKRGAEACEKLNDDRERRGVTFLIASERCRLAHEGRDESADVLPPFYRNMSVFLPLAINNLPYMREIYWGDWFWHAGALIKDDPLAREVYEAGLWNELLPTGASVGDATLLGWAGTLAVRDGIDAKTLQHVREHLSGGFWQRINAERIRSFGGSATIIRRLRAGLARLEAIQIAMEFAEGGSLPRADRRTTHRVGAANDRRKGLPRPAFAR
jgi:hypothetical protein